MNLNKISNKILVNIIGLISFLSVVAYFIIYYESETIKISNNLNNTIIIKGNVKHFEGALLANAANETHDIQLAEKLYKIALNKVKADKKWEVYYNMGCTYNEHEKYQKAIQALEKAINLNPNCNLCFEGLADSYFSLKNAQESLIYFNKAFSIKPSARAYFNRSLVYIILLNQFDEAIEDLKNSIKLDSYFFKSYFELILLLLNNNRINEAKVYYNEYSKIINSNDILNFQDYLLIKFNINFIERNYDEYFKTFLDLCELNSKNIKLNTQQIDYSRFMKNYYTTLIINFCLQKSLTNAIKIISYAIEAAIANDDQDFEVKLRKDFKYIKALLKKNDPNYKYKRGSLEIDS